MLFDTQPTPFDVQFRLFGFPVRVLPWFWLVAALFGDWTLQQLGPAYLILWVACVFVSILIHELGHAILMRRFGARCHILLVAFFGLAIPDGTPAERWKRIAIPLAGPGAGFLFAGVLYISNLALEWRSVSLGTFIAYSFLMSINISWGLFNLLPIWPLDGGRVCRELCGASSARNPDAVAFGISFFLAAILVLVGLLVFLRRLPPAIEDQLPFVPGPFMTLWMVMFAIQSYQLWQQAQNAGRWDAGDDYDRSPWR